MRIFKKSLVFTIVVAMVLSLVMFGVLAEEDNAQLTFKVRAAENKTDTIGSANPGDTIYVDVCITPGTYSAISVEITPCFPVQEENIVIHYPSMVSSVNGANVRYLYPMDITMTQTPLMTIAMTIPAHEGAGDISLFTYDQNANQYSAGGSDIVNLSIEPCIFAIQNIWTASCVVNPEPVCVEIGTTEEEMLEKLPKTVTIKKEEKPEAVGLEVDVAWSGDGTYDETVIGAYAYVGILSASADSVILPTEPVLSATVMVYVTASTTKESTSVPATLELMEKEDKSAYTAEEIIAYVKETVGVITVNKGEMLDTFATDKYIVEVKDGTTISGTKVGEKILMTIILGATSDHDKFALADKNAKIEVAVEIIENTTDFVPVPELPNEDPSAGPEKPNYDIPGDTTRPVKPETPTDTGELKQPEKEKEPEESEEPEDAASDKSAENLFEDVTADHWAYDYIKEMKDLGVVGGKTDDTFEPESNITRAEFVKMIATAFGLDATATESDFEDCGSNDWYTPYVIAAAEAGYVNGVSSAAFGANDHISRQDICAILGRILGLNPEEETTFVDMNDVADYALNAVKALAGTGILKGYEDGSFAPTKSATRAEVCKILSSVLALELEIPVADVTEEETAETETESSNANKKDPPCRVALFHEKYCSILSRRSIG